MKKFSSFGQPASDRSNYRQFLPAFDILETADVIVPCDDRRDGCGTVPATSCNLIQYDGTRSYLHNLSASRPPRSPSESRVDILGVSCFSAEPHPCLNERTSDYDDFLPAVRECQPEVLNEFPALVYGLELPIPPESPVNDIRSALMYEPAVATTSGLLETVTHAMDDWLQQEITFEGGGRLGPSFNESLPDPWLGGKEATLEEIFLTDERAVLQGPSRSQPITTAHATSRYAALVMAEEDLHDATSASLQVAQVQCTPSNHADASAGAGACNDADANADTNADAVTTAGAGANADFHRLVPAAQNLQCVAHAVSGDAELMLADECHASVDGGPVSSAVDPVMKSPQADQWKDGGQVWQLLQMFANRGMRPTATEGGIERCSKVHPCSNVQPCSKVHQRSEVQQHSDVHPLGKVQQHCSTNMSFSTIAQQLTCQSADLEHPCQQRSKRSAPEGVALRQLLQTLCRSDSEVIAEQPAMQHGDGMRQGEGMSTLQQVESYGCDTQGQGGTMQMHRYDPLGCGGDGLVDDRDSHMHEGDVQGLNDGVQKHVSKLLEHGRNAQRHGCGSQVRDGVRKHMIGGGRREEDSVQPQEQLQQMLDSFQRRLRTTAAAAPALPAAAVGATATSVEAAAAAAVGATATSVEAAAAAAAEAASAAQGQTREGVMCRRSGPGREGTLEEREASNRDEGGASKLVRMSGDSGPTSCMDVRDVRGVRDVSEARNKISRGEDVGDQKAVCSTGIGAARSPAAHGKRGRTSSLGGRSVAVGLDGSTIESPRLEVYTSRPLLLAGGLCVAASKTSYPYLHGLVTHPTVQGQRETRLVGNLMGLAEAIMGQDEVQLRCFRRRVRREINGLTLRGPFLFSSPPPPSLAASSSTLPDSKSSNIAYSASLIASQRQDDAAVRVARHFLQALDCRANGAALLLRKKPLPFTLNETVKATGSHPRIGVLWVDVAMSAMFQHIIDSLSTPPPPPSHTPPPPPATLAHTRGGSAVSDRVLEPDPLPIPSATLCHSEAHLFASSRSGCTSATTLQSMPACAPAPWTSIQSSPPLSDPCPPDPHKAASGSRNRSAHRPPSPSATPSLSSSSSPSPFHCNHHHPGACPVPRRVHLILFGIPATRQWMFLFPRLAAVLANGQLPGSCRASEPLANSCPPVAAAEQSQEASCAGCACPSVAAAEQSQIREASASACACPSVAAAEQSQSQEASATACACPSHGHPSVRFTHVDLSNATLVSGNRRVEQAVTSFQQCGNVVGLDVTYRAVEVLPELFRPDMVEVDPCEEVVVCSNWSMMVFPDSSVVRFNLRDAVLQWIRSLNPRVVLLAELDANLNGPFFMPRYRELLRLVMAMLQCTDATMVDSCLPAGVMAETLLSLCIANCLGCEGVERWFRPERFEQWQHRMHRLGFQAVLLSDEVMSEASQVISEAKRRSSCPSFEVEHVEGTIKLRWRGTPVITVGAWR